MTPDLEDSSPLELGSDEIIATLKTNQEKGTGVMLLPPMAGGPNGFGGLFDNDLNDLAQYVHTLPPVMNGPFGHPDM